MAANLVVPERMREAREHFSETGIATEAGVEAFARILCSGHRRIVMTSETSKRLLRRGAGGRRFRPTAGGRAAQAHSSASETWRGER